MIRPVSAAAAPPAPPRAQAAAPVDGSLLGRPVDDLLNLSQLLAAGKLYKMAHQDALAAEQGHPLRGVPRVDLPRPFLVVPGWTTKPEKFGALVDKLTEGGRNGGRAYYVKDGTVYEDPACARPLPGAPADARVFVGVFHDRLETPDATAAQIDRSLKAIRGGTGASRVDVQGYSMGGLAVRVYLDRGGQDVGRAVLLGTPNQGSRFAELSARLIRRDIGWAMRLAGLTVADLPAMDWMAAGNPRVQDLNSRWPQQEARTEGVRLVGARELATPARGLLPLRKGDGLVEASGLALPGADVHLLAGRPTLQHGHLPTDPGVYREMMDFFGWQVSV